MADQEAALRNLISEVNLKDWNDAIDIRIRLTARAGRGRDADQLNETRQLLKRLAALKSKHHAAGRPRVFSGPAGSPAAAFGCKQAETRAFAIAPWRTIDPPNTSGTIETKRIQQQYGTIEFWASLMNTNAYDPNDPDDYAVWLQQWVCLYTFPVSPLPSTITYQFQMWPNTSWACPRYSEPNIIMLHLGIEHVGSLGSVGGPIDTELWPLVIDTVRDGNAHFPPWTDPITISGSFDAPAGATPALALFPGVFAIVPFGQEILLPDGFFWFGNNMPADTDDRRRWGWIDYCIEEKQVLAPPNG